MLPQCLHKKQLHTVLKHLQYTADLFPAPIQVRPLQHIQLLY